MPSKDFSRLQPVQLNSSHGPLCGVYYPPVGASKGIGDVLVAPAFAEEMNRCRAMISMQARAFAEQGIGTLVLDPYGTGDSGGEFSDFTWSRGRDDLRSGVEWLRTRGNGCSTVWGTRLGAIWAAELAVADPSLKRLVLWQPVLQGKNFLTQFLRIRIAAEMEEANGIKTTEELRARSRGGETIEVSGYDLCPDLCKELDEIRFPDVKQLAHTSIVWCEVLPSAEAPVSVPATKAIDACKAAGLTVSFAKTIGPSFWQVHERMEAPELIAATAELVNAWNEQSSATQSVRAPVAESQPQQTERTITFDCGDAQLIGVLHRGDQQGKRGVVGIVAGGPQYRAGAHRQFVSLSRKLAQRGYPVLRFDLRGMGDSSGTYLGFQQSAPDIKSAIDALLAQQPQLSEVVLFGECESASGILFYAYRDPRVAGVVLVNPWVRTDEGRAEVIIKHYYRDRLFSAEFWRKIFSGKFNPFASLQSFFGEFQLYRQGVKANKAATGDAEEADIDSLPLPQKTAAGFKRFRGPIFVLMSGHDYIAREFDAVVKSVPAWKGLLDNPRVERRDMEGADHTFSRAIWKQQAQDWIDDWIARN